MRNSLEKILKGATAVAAVLCIGMAVLIYQGHEPSVGSMVLDQILLAALFLEIGWRRGVRS